MHQLLRVCFLPLLVTLVPISSLNANEFHHKHTMYFLLRRDLLDYWFDIPVYVCLCVRDILLVGLRTLLLREKVFTLCLQMFLDQFFPRNPRVPTTFEKRCPTCPFWPIFGPLVGHIKKALLFDINNIFSIKYQQLLCFEIRLIHWYSFKNHRKLINVSKSKMAATTSK